MLEPPPNLEHLFPYQLDGTHWLLQHNAALLADEMGLGKTIQAISALRILISQGKASRSLIVCPKSLVPNWIAEFKKWAPELVVEVFQRSSSSAEVQHILEKNHVVVANYEKLLKWGQIEVSVLVADEAHRVRNIGAEVSQGVRAIRATWRWAITGTPIERDLEDFATILSFLDPLRFSADDSKVSAASLRSRASPYVLRRTRDAVLSDLPNVVEHQERLALLPAQRVAYDTLLSSANRPGTDYIALVGQLRMVCDYEPKSGESVKIDRAVEILQEIAKMGEKALVFSYLIEPLKLLGRALDRVGFELTHLLFDGSLDIAARQRVVDRFKNDPKVGVLLASTRATSEGLTLTEANHVIFLNLWWNPSANQQARDRVVRIGQRKVVQTYSFICDGTIEEDLERILGEKWETYREVVDQLSNVGRPAEAGFELARKLIKGR